MYTLVQGVLYKRGTQGVLMRCIPQNEGLKLLHDIHWGICGTHASYRTLVGKAFRQGFYWPTALYDAKELVKKCVQCQFHSRQIHQPAQALQTITHLIMNRFAASIVIPVTGLALIHFVNVSIATKGTRSRLALWGTGLGYRDPRSQKAKTEVLFVMPEPVGVFACYETGIVHTF